MRKGILIGILAMLAVLIGAGVWFWHWLNPIFPQVTSDSGKVYAVYTYEPEEVCLVKGVDFSTATRERVEEVLKPVEIDVGASGEITTPEQAACRGASILETAMIDWTQCDSLSVAYHETAGVWVVHGMMENGESDGSVGILVLDGVTGEVLGIAEERPEYRM